VPFSKIYYGTAENQLQVLREFFLAANRANQHQSIQNKKITGSGRGKDRREEERKRRRAEKAYDVRAKIVLKPVDQVFLGTYLTFSSSLNLS
jgi:hypothetical protein